MRNSKFEQTKTIISKQELARLLDVSASNIYLNVVTGIQLIFLQCSMIKSNNYRIQDLGTIKINKKGKRYVLELALDEQISKMVDGAEIPDKIIKQILLDNV